MKNKAYHEAASMFTASASIIYIVTQGPIILWKLIVMGVMWWVMMLMLITIQIIEKGR